MTMQNNEARGGLFHSAVGQMTLLGAAIVVVLIIAWFYVW
jgi:hypothetical protein